MNRPALHPTRATESQAWLRRRAMAVWLGGLVMALSLPVAAAAELSVEERLPLVQPRVELLRKSLLNPRLDPQQIEEDYAVSLQKAEQLWDAEKGPEALLALSPLQKYAPIAELPFIKAQLLMAAIAQQQRNLELRNHHRAFATALVNTIHATGDGQNTQSAFRLVLPSEADGWLIANRDRYQPLGKEVQTSGNRRFDVWRVTANGGVEQRLYFDTTAMLRKAVRPQPLAKPAQGAAAKTASPPVQKNQKP